MSYDLFISYSRRDNGQERVKQLIDWIKTDFAAFAGRPLVPFFDDKEINGMEDWRQRILHGVRESRLFLACVSPAYLRSEYCEWEFNEYLKHEIGRFYGGEGVAPIYFVEVPGWQDRDFDQRCAPWVAELRRRQHFDLRSWYTTGHEALRDEVIQARMEKLREQIHRRILRGERMEQSLGNVDAHNAHFIGRVFELRRLHEAVALGKVGVLTAVHGLGGMGKTGLAIEYAHNFAHEYGGGRWQLRCEGRDDLFTTIAQLAPALGVEFNDTEKLDSQLQFQRVLQELHRLAEAREPHRCLLVLDNVDQPKLLEPAQLQKLPSADWLHVIATTRMGEHDLFGSRADRAFVAVDEIPEDDALALIEGYQRGGSFSDTKEREAAREIAHLLGGLTLAVETTAVFLGQFTEVTCGAFLERLKLEGLAGIEGAAVETTEGARHGEKRLTATFQPTFERLSEPEKLALLLAALLPADEIALPWIRALISVEFPEIGNDAEAGYPDPWLNLVRRLISLRLLQPRLMVDGDRQPRVARMHRLVQELVSNRESERVEQFRNSLAKHAVMRSKFLRKGWPEYHNRWEIEPLHAFAEALLVIEHFDAPYLAKTIGESLFELARYSDAERLIRLVVELFEKNHWVDPILAALINNLAVLLVATNRPTEAESLLETALTIDEQFFGREHTTVARDLTNLAWLLRETNRLREAEPLMRRALVIFEKILGSEHVEVADCLNNLAQLLKATDRLREAEPLMQRVLAIYEQHFGLDHPKVALSLNNLARLLSATNRLSEAEPLMRRALAIDEKIFGLEHPDVARDLNNVAQLLIATNRLSEAEPLMRRALAIYEQTLGPEHPLFAESLMHLASVLERTNRLKEAEVLLRRALAIDEQELGPTHPRVAVCLNQLAQLLQRTHRMNEAEPLMRRVLSIDAQSFGLQHTSVATALNNLAGLLWNTNRLTEAEPLMRRAVEILLRFTVSTGHEHPRLRDTIHNYSSLLVDLGYTNIRARLTALGVPFDMQFGG